MLLLPSIIPQEETKVHTLNDIINTYTQYTLHTPPAATITVFLYKTCFSMLHVLIFALFVFACVYN